MELCVKILSGDGKKVQAATVVDILQFLAERDPDFPAKRAETATKAIMGELYQSNWFLFHASRRELTREVVNDLLRIHLRN